MANYDILMLVVLVATTLFGFYKGVAWQVASLASIGASYFVAIRFRAPVAELIGADPPWNVFLAMLILYLGTSLFVWLVFRVVSKTIDELKLKSFDRQVGALFGAAKGVLLCVVITLFAVTLLSEGQRDTIMRSRSGFYIAQLLDRAHGVMPDELHDVLHPYLHKLDELTDEHDSAYSHAHDAEAFPVSPGVETLQDMLEPYLRGDQQGSHDGTNGVGADFPDARGLEADRRTGPFLDPSRR